MSSFATRTRCWPFRWFLVTVLLLGCTGLLLGCAGVAWAQTEPTVVHVEEDWELVVGEPDPTTASPQILCVFSPVGHVGSLHSSLQLNHHNTFELDEDGLPVFAPGGMQFEVWEGETPLREKKFPITAVLSTPGEVITWTQSMELESGKLTFEIKNGNSSAWGNFGGEGYLKPYPVNTTLTDLNGYNSDVSVQNSGVSYAANRVQSLTLKRVRYYTSTGEVVEDTTARVVHSLD